MKEPLKRVLLAEDNSDVRNYMRNILTHLYYEVTECATLVEFREMLSLQRWDLIVSDLNFDGEGESFQLLAEARAIYPYTPIILVTGDELQGVWLRAEACDVDFVMSKPLLPKQLRRGIEIASAKRSAISPGNPLQNSQMTTS